MQYTVVCFNVCYGYEIESNNAELLTLLVPLGMVAGEMVVVLIVGMVVRVLIVPSMLRPGVHKVLRVTNLRCLDGKVGVADLVDLCDISQKEDVEQRVLGFAVFMGAVAVFLVVAIVPIHLVIIGVVLMCWLIVSVI